MEAFLEMLVLYGMFLFGISSRDNLWPGPGDTQEHERQRTLECAGGSVLLVSICPRK